MNVNGWIFAEIFINIPPPNPFVAFVVQLANVGDVWVVVVVELSVSLIPPPSTTLELPHKLKIDDDTVTFTLAADVGARMDELGVVGVMDVKLVEMIETVLADVPLEVMRGWVECMALHCTPSNSTFPPLIATNQVRNRLAEE